MTFFLLAIAATLAWSQQDRVDVSNLNLKEGPYKLINGDEDGCPGETIDLRLKKSDSGTDLFLGENFVVPAIDVKQVKAVGLETECSENTEHLFDGKSFVQISRHDNCKDPANNITNKITITPLKGSFNLKVENFRGSKKAPFYKIFCTYRFLNSNEKRNQ